MQKKKKLISGCIIISLTVCIVAIILINNYGKDNPIKAEIAAADSLQEEATLTTAEDNTVDNNSDGKIKVKNSDEGTVHDSTDNHHDTDDSFHLIIMELETDESDASSSNSTEVAPSWDTEQSIDEAQVPQSMDENDLKIIPVK